MYPTIPATPSSAATSCNRLELVGSRRAGLAWLSWLTLACVCVAATDIHGCARLAIGAGVAAAGIAPLPGFVFLRGPRSMRALEWFDHEPEVYFLYVRSGRRLRVVPEGCRRYGQLFWLLRFRSEEGVHRAMLDLGLQDARAVRRLGRRQLWGPDTANAVSSGRPAAGC